MSVTVLLITHEGIGYALLNTVRTMLEDLPLPTTAINVDYDIERDALMGKIQRFVKTVATQDGVLVLTDLYGSTPYHVAASLQHNNNIKVIAGLNLSMLTRIMNYPTLGLDALAQKALSGGKDGIINCSERDYA